MRRSSLLVFLTIGFAGLASAADLNPKKATDAELVACLQDPSPELRTACIEQFERRGLLAQQDALAGVARSDAAPKVRVAALEALRGLEAPVLANTAEHMALHDPLADNRGHALGVLEKHGTDTSAPAVVQAMADSDATIARKAVIIVGKRGYSEGEPWLAEHGVNHSEPAVVVQAWVTLTRLGNPDLRPAVHEALQAGNEAVRKAIARAMRDTVLPIDKDPLVRALDDSNTHVARDASKALIELGDPSVAPILREKAGTALDESVSKDFLKAAEALGG